MRLGKYSIAAQVPCKAQGFCQPLNETMNQGTHSFLVITPRFLTHRAAASISF